jgi:phenylacetate-CoA ligase
MSPKFQRALYSLYLSLIKKPVFRYLEQLRESQSYPISRLREIQLDKLKSIVEYAYRNTTYYKEEFDKRDVSPDQIKSVEDLRLLPVLSKETIRNAFDDLLSQSHMQKLLHGIGPLSTVGESGTAGTLAINTVFSGEYLGTQLGRKENYSRIHY